MRFETADPGCLKATFDSPKQQNDSINSFLETVIELNSEKLKILKILMSKFLY